MEGARVAVIEDDDFFRDITRRHLERCGHFVVAEATNLTQALGLVGEIAQGNPEVDVILLDGNLREGARDGEDARQIVSKIKETNVKAKVFGFSLSPMSSYGIEVDVDTDKNWQRLEEGLKQL